MGGRAAEELVFGDITTGAGNDIQQATSIARNMVMQWGMSEAVGPINLSPGDEQYFLGRDIGTERPYGEDTAEQVDKEVHHILQGCYDKTKQLLQQHVDKLHQLAKRLIEIETVEAEEIHTLVTPAMA
jgi:cell division protease FtsH